jgi:Domain of unknown function (DUF5615)
LAAFYLDEDAMPDVVINGLRLRGIDVVSANTESMRGRSDDEQLDFATRNLRAIFTHNIRDFRRLHTIRTAAGIDHSGIVMVQKRRYHPGELVLRLERLARARTPIQLVNALEYLQDWGDDRDE